MAESQPIDCKPAKKIAGSQANGWEASTKIFNFLLLRIWQPLLAGNLGEKTQKLKLLQNSKTKIVTKLKKNCFDKT